MRSSAAFSTVSWRNSPFLLLRLLLGGVFLYAAWSKLREPWALFAISVDAYGILPQWAVVAVARALPWAELLLGLMLLAGRFVRVSSSAASLLLAGFFTLLVRAYFAGLRIECGCFGSGDPLSPRTLARDGLLLAASLLLTALAWTRRPRPKPSAVTPPANLDSLV